LALGAHRGGVLRLAGAFLICCLMVPAPRVGEQIEKEIVVDRDALDRDPFAADGGFARLNKVFDGEIEGVLSGINEEMWRKAA
jgi:hypothetical protein